LGPKPDAFYAEMGSEEPLAAARQMLSELLAAFNASAKPSKVLCFRWAMVVLVVSFLGCIPVMLVRPS
jgi:hypothetical protein